LLILTKVLSTITPLERSLTIHSITQPSAVIDTTILPHINSFTCDVIFL
jgi:hypothetical protein